MELNLKCLLLQLVTSGVDVTHILKGGPFKRFGPRCGQKTPGQDKRLIIIVSVMDRYTLRVKLKLLRGRIWTNFST